MVSMRNLSIRSSIGPSWLYMIDSLVLIVLSSKVLLLPYIRSLTIYQQFRPSTVRSSGCVRSLNHSGQNSYDILQKKFVKVALVPEFCLENEGGGGKVGMTHPKKEAF